MHIEILNENQKKLLLILSNFKKEYYLVGGTAIALYLGHRNSIDFDLFTSKTIKRKSLKNLLETHKINYTVLHEAFDQLHIIAENVKLTFFNFPFEVEHKNNFENYITMPSLIDLAAMKVFALGGRAKWKDYLDLYFILHQQISLPEIEDRASKIFGERFNKKLLRQQMAYFDDIDYSEPIIYIGKEQPSEQQVKEFLINQALIEF
jgi:predicted nucleotidyltransferase component of viral defense system